LITGECNIINPAIKTHISPDGHTLYILDIPEEDIGKLSFPTNTDNNNNKLTLTNAFVSLVSNPLRTITIPGFADQMIYAFNDSNSRGFRNLDVIHKPFAALPAGFYSPSKPTLTPSILADTLAGITTFTQPTRGSPKYFGLTLTNDTSTSDTPIALTIYEFIDAMNAQYSNIIPAGSMITTEGTSGPGAAIFYYSGTYEMPTVTQNGITGIGYLNMQPGQALALYPGVNLTTPNTSSLWFQLDSTNNDSTNNDSNNPIIYLVSSDVGSGSINGNTSTDNPVVASNITITQISCESIPGAGGFDWPPCNKSEIKYLL
jgi:hypothetical protein